VSFRLVLVAAVCLGVGGPLKGEGADPMVYRTGNPADWPEDKDAVIAAPKNHRILLENDTVRVLDVTVAPGEVEAVHSHRWPSVLYFMTAGDFIDRDADGKIILDTRTMKTPLKFPLTMWKEPEAPHSVENLSKTITLHLVRVETKKLPTGSPSPSCGGGGQRRCERGSSFRPKALARDDAGAVRMSLNAPEPSGGRSRLGERRGRSPGPVSP